jgi:hypothetical protein
MSKLKEKLKRTWSWIKEGQMLFYFILAIVIAIIIYCTCCNMLDEYGNLLQILGLYFTAVGIGKKLNLLQKGHICDFFIDWLKRNPFSGNRHYHISAEVGDLNYEVSGGISFDHKRVVKEGDFNDLKDYLDEQIDALNKKIKLGDSNVLEKLKKVENRLGSKINHIESQLSETSDKLDQAITPDLWQELFGLLIVALGIILTVI